MEAAKDVTWHFPFTHGTSKRELLSRHHLMLSPLAFPSLVLATRTPMHVQ